MLDAYLSAIKSAILSAAVAEMQSIGEDAAADMRSNLTLAGHVDTGDLLNSIRSETHVDLPVIRTDVYADARADDGSYYGDFLEHGTGAAHGRPGGRVGTWRYKGRDGNWYTTDGMDADPFVEPSREKHEPTIAGRVAAAIIKAANDPRGA